MRDMAVTTEQGLQRKFDLPRQSMPGTVRPLGHRASGLRTETNLYLKLRQAVRDNAFRLAYQPILDLRSGRVIGAESLLRLQDGTKVIPAGEFIETLEQSDLLDIVADKTLFDACRNAAWIHKNLQSNFRIAVNVAPQQWMRGTLLDAVNYALHESGCNPAMLDLEITERTGLSDSFEVQTTIRRFRDQGISITIDDFGTGHANFSCLKRFPISHLKIDKYYCRHSKAHSKVLEPVITAAHRAGITCTAEGVETESQLRQLKALDCDEAQGFYIARPMDFESLVTSLQTGSFSAFWRRQHAS
jgi:EAL domain-containing protein (putative c-di-GMP-specific phosphodiesterase class I)